MKYYTAFLFEGLEESEIAGQDPLHVTHKYLGEQSSEDIAAVVKCIDQYVYGEHVFLPHPPWPFAQEAFFGEKKDIRVLLPLGESAWSFWPKLREQLAKFRTDDFSGYQPHVTTKTAGAINQRISCYALIGGGQIVAQWMRR